jgi:hypothetical protein
VYVGRLGLRHAAQQFRVDALFGEEHCFHESERCKYHQLPRLTVGSGMTFNQEAWYESPESRPLTGVHLTYRFLHRHHTTSDIVETQPFVIRTGYGLTKHHCSREVITWMPETTSLH